MGWMSEENVLPRKALTLSALLPVLCLALVTQDNMSHQLAAAPETMDRMKMHPSFELKRATVEANGTGQSGFVQKNF